LGKKKRPKKNEETRHLQNLWMGTRGGFLGGMLGETSQFYGIKETCYDARGGTNVGMKCTLTKKERKKSSGVT